MKRTILLSILLIVFLAGCTNTGFGGRGSANILVDYFDGTEGVVIEFLEQAPPDELYEGEEFDVQLLIHNKGAYSLIDDYDEFDSFGTTQGSAASVILDYSPSSAFIEMEGVNFAGSQQLIENLVQLEGKSYNYPIGEQLYVAMGRFQAKDIRGDFETNEGFFSINLCYPYQTFFADQVCIDTNVDGTNLRDQICTSQDRTYSGGQGAPIVVTSVETQFIPRGAYIQPQFVITIENKGNGVPSKYVTEQVNGLLTCPLDIPSTDVGVIIPSVTLGGDKLNCLPQEIILNKGEGELRCQLSEDKILGVASNYETTLAVELAYLYNENYEQEVVVERTADLSDRARPALDTSECFSWQVYDSQTNTCADLCPSLAQSRDGFIASTLVAPHAAYISDDLLWNSIDCLYSDASACKRAGDEYCVLEQNYCQPGRFCGVPQCIFNNAAPIFSEVERVGDSIRFYCADIDDKDNLKQTCGCTETAYYLFTDNKDDCDQNIALFNPISGKNSVFGIEFEVAIPDVFDESELPKHLCLKVQDKVGDISSQRLNSPFTLEWRR